MSLRRELCAKTTGGLIGETECMEKKREKCRSRYRRLGFKGERGNNKIRTTAQCDVTTNPNAAKELGRKKLERKQENLLHFPLFDERTLLRKRKVETIFQKIAFQIIGDFTRSF